MGQAALGVRQRAAQGLDLARPFRESGFALRTHDRVTALNISTFRLLMLNRRPQFVRETSLRHHWIGITCSVRCRTPEIDQTRQKRPSFLTDLS